MVLMAVKHIFYQLRYLICPTLFIFLFCFSLLIPRGFLICSLLNPPWLLILKWSDDSSKMKQKQKIASYHDKYGENFCMTDKVKLRRSLEVTRNLQTLARFERTSNNKQPMSQASQTSYWSRLMLLFSASSSFAMILQTVLCRSKVSREILKRKSFAAFLQRVY